MVADGDVTVAAAIPTVVDTKATAVHTAIVPSLRYIKASSVDVVVVIAVWRLNQMLETLLRQFSYEVHI